MPDQPAATPPSPSPSDPGAADSSAASSAASPTSSGGFIADPGPTFDPEAAAAAPPPPIQDAEPVAAIEWEQDTLESLLTLKGRAMHAAIGVGEDDWRYTELDLKAIAPPLTRIANRYEPIQRLAKHADPLVLFFAFGGYAVRSLEERAAVLRALEPADVEEIPPLSDDEPINGPGTAPAGTPPPPPTPPVGSTGHVAVPPAPPAPVQQADVDVEATEWSTVP